MQFIANGPDIPDELLQAHEEGRVVFFCGAGISYPADLPDFKGLVERIYELNGTALSESDAEKEAFDQKQYDATLNLLERRLPGQRLAVRRALAQVLLKPKLRRTGAIDTQIALLRLGRNREGLLRLVTTNFDRIFHVAAKRTGQTFQTHAAPMLPIPKNSRWNGLIYLHGLLPEKIDDSALNRLVVTSGDFGLAYLTERWAARFVSELFRNYVVCFVGYSINDPVLRYMMDAMAADRMLGEVTPQAWAFGSCEDGNEHIEAVKWQAKGVTPVLYSNTNNHSALHQTLHAWAETYRDGVQGKEAIVVKHAMTRPQESTQQDNFVGRMLWALADRSGLPAKRFADFNPAPSLDWLLESFEKEYFGYADLSRFDVPARNVFDAKLSFSLIQRPASYDRAPPMLLAFDGFTASQWDHVMTHIARWLVRHLDDPRLVIWIAERGGHLHDRWQLLIENKLDHLTSLQREGKTSELEVIRTHAPNAVPSHLMRTLWRLLLGGRVKSPRHGHDFYRWIGHLKRDGLTATIRLELRELLAPSIVLKKPFRWNEDNSWNAEPTQIKQLVDWDLELKADHVSYALRDLANQEWTSALPDLLVDFQQLLRDALDMLRELGEADDQNDRSHWDLPSITPHRQNRGFRDWVSLIELVRDAWLAVCAKDIARATSIAQNWYGLPYPTFKRLALFAASQNGCITSEQWVDWLLVDNAWWLWTTDTRREVSRLLVLQGQHLTADAQEALETAILAGPPREMFYEDLENGRWQDLQDHSVWLRLIKLRESGRELSALANARLVKISTDHPQWRLAPNERDEFSSWMSGTGDPDFEDNRDIDIAPRKRQELFEWLLKPVPAREARPFYEDTWELTCKKHLLNCLCALNDLSQEGLWPSGRWRKALMVWSDKKMTSRSWRYAAPLVQAMPDERLIDIANSVTHWMEAVSKSTSNNETILFNMCKRVLGLPLDADSPYKVTRGGVQIFDPVGEAINHPIGHVTQTLLNLWFKKEPKDNDLLSSELKSIFSELCNVEIDRFKHGRVLLASNLIALIRVDRQWTEHHLLPLFEWSNPREAKAVWEGFLWSPRLYQPLLTAFKPQFLDTATQYSELGEHQQQFAAILTYAALGPTEGYTAEEFRSAIGTLPKHGLEHCAQALYQALEGAGNQREDYWKNRAQPFWQKVWPKSRDLTSPQMAESLARMVIAARGEFPGALDAVKDWLEPVEHPDYVVHLLHGSGLCSRYPADALTFLNAVINDQKWRPRELQQCMNAIVEVAPSLAGHHCFLRINEYLRRSEA